VASLCASQGQSRLCFVLLNEGCERHKAFTHCKCASSACEPVAMPACAGSPMAWQRQVCSSGKDSLQSRALQPSTMMQSSSWHRGLPVHCLQRSSRRLLMRLALVLWHGTTSSNHGCGSGCASPPLLLSRQITSNGLCPNRCGCRIPSTTSTSGLSSTAFLTSDRRRRC